MEPGDSWKPARLELRNLPGGKTLDLEGLREVSYPILFSFYGIIYPRWFCPAEKPFRGPGV